MIKLKDLLLENESPNIFIPRKVDDRQIKYNQLTQKEVNKIIDDYNKKSNEGKSRLDLSGKGSDYFGYSLLNHEGEFIIPDTLKEVKDGLNLENSNVTKLPDNLTIGEYKIYPSSSHLNLEKCKKLTALPKGLKVASISADESGLIDIPDDLQCISLDLKYTKIKQLPLFKNFIKNIDLEGSKLLKTLPDGFTAGDLSIEANNSLVSIPNNVNLNLLIIRECSKLTSIGSNCTFDRLIISYGCDKFINLPTDIKANLVSMLFEDIPFRRMLFDKFKTKQKVLNALKKMYPNVKKFDVVNQRAGRPVISL